MVLLLALVFGPTASAQVAIVAGSSASLVENSGTTNTRTLSYTVPPGSNRLLVVTSEGGGNNINISSVTWNGGAMNQAAQIMEPSGLNSNAGIWYLTMGSSATSSTANITVTYANNFFWIMTATTFSGVNQTTPVSGGTTGTSASLSVSSATGNMVVDAIGGAPTNATVGGGQTAIATASSLSFSSQSAGASTASGASSVSMSWSGFTSDVVHAGVSINQAAATAVPPTISQAFSPTSIPVGNSSTLTFTVTNPNAATALTGVGFSETLPAGLMIATPNGLVGSAGGGTITATAGGGTISVSGATLAAGASFTFSVNVTSAVPGFDTSVTSPITSTNAGNGNTASATLTVNRVTPAINTTQNPASGTVGTTFKDSAVLSGGFNPTGTLTFQLYNNPNGTGTPLDSESVTVNGNGTYTTPTGDTTTATGTFYWVATYSGDTNNSNATSGTALEPVVVSPATPTINTTQQPASARVGISIADKATVSGGFNPTGTVTFNLYNNPNGTGAPLFTDTELLVSGVATSQGYTATAAGTDYWVATYNGDPNNNPVTAGTALEPVVVTPAAPTISCTAQQSIASLGTTIKATATLAGGFNPTGTVIFQLYNNPNGTGNPFDSETVTVNGNGVYQTPVGYGTNAAGTFYWVATYSGDTNNNGVSSVTSSAPVTVLDTVAITASGTPAVVGGPTSSYTFSRLGTAGPLAVNFQLDAASTATTSQFSLSGASFNTGTGAGSVVIPSGSNSVTVTLTASPNVTGSAQPSLTVQLDLAAGASYSIGAQASATVTILQNGFVVTDTNDSGSGSLRQAVLNANALLGSPTITFSTALAGQTITLTSGEIAISTSLTIDGGGQAITITGNNASRAFNVNASSGGVVISNLALTNCHTTSNGSAITAATQLTLNNCTLANNAVTRSGFGDTGGVIFSSSTLALSNCSLSNNTITGAGGAVWVQGGSLTMANCTVSGNTCNPGPASGILIQGSTASLSNCTVSGNSGSTTIDVLAQASNSSLTMQNCTLNGNSVANINGFGSALTLQAGNPSFTASAVLTNCTVSGNTNTSASGPGAISVQTDGGPTMLTLVNTIISGNLTNGVETDITGTADPNSNHNLIGSSSGGLTNGSNGNIVGVTNPLLAPLGNYGGPVQTMALLPGSPAIGAGTSSGAPTTDARGVTRANPPDIGAFESQGFTMTVASGNNQSTTVNTAFTNPLVATVTANNPVEPVAGGSVTFTAPSSGASATFAGGGTAVNVTINGSGAATSPTVTANTIPGAYSVTATILNSTASAAFSLTNNSGLATHLTVTGNSGATAGVPLTVTVTALDQFGNTATGYLGTVHFSSSDIAPGVVLPANYTFTLGDSGVHTFTNGVTLVTFGNQTVTAKDTLNASITGTGTFSVSTLNPSAAQMGNTATADPQTGLFDLTVNVTNTTNGPINGFRLHVNYSSYVKAYPSLKLFNATSLANYPDVYVDYPYPVAHGAMVPVNLEFYTSTRTFPNPFKPVLTVTTLNASETAQANPPTGSVPVTRIVKLSNGNILLEFPSTPGSWYRITYSDDMKNWFLSDVPIQASATQTQWIDNGAPLTSAPPSTVKSRFYYVQQIPAP